MFLWSDISKDFYEAPIAFKIYITLRILINLFFYFLSVILMENLGSKTPKLQLLTFSIALNRFVLILFLMPFFQALYIAKM